MSAKDDSEVCKFSVNEMGKLAEKYILCVSGASFQAAAKASPKIFDFVDRITIFARMTPDLKETIVAELKSRGSLCVALEILTSFKVTSVSCAVMVPMMLVP